jgi:protein tyrosine phosphatase (PTP) superfamily phosphohydrolase (DUF442 family)
MVANAVEVSRDVEMADVEETEDKGLDSIISHPPQKLQQSRDSN